MASNPWDNDPIVQPSPQQFPGVIQGAPKRPAPQTPEQVQSDRLGNQLTEIKINEAREKQEAEAAQRRAMELGITDSVYQMRNVVEAAKKAKELSQTGFFATGFGASYARDVGGTTAADVKALLNTIGSNTAFDRLQKMREESPTGGALGAVSEIELQLLRDSVASLEQSQSDAQFQENMDKVIESYERVINRLGGGGTELEKTKETQGGEGPAAEDFEEGYSEEGGLKVRVTDDSPASPDGPVMGPNNPGFWNQIGMGTGDLVETAGDTLGLVANPLNAGVNAVLGTNLSTDLGQTLREAAQLPQSSDNIFSAVNKFAGGAMMGAGLARQLGSVLKPGTAQAVAQTLGRTPIRDTVAGAGAGAGSFIGRESGLPGGEYAGAILGGVSGYGVGSMGANAMAPRGMNAIAAAAERQGVSVLPADVGGRASQMVTAGTKASPISAGPVVKQAQENVRQLGDRTRQIAEGQGNIGTTDAAGESIRSAASNYAEQTRSTWGRLYDRAHEAAKGVKIKPLATLNALDARIARLKNDPSTPESAVTELQSFRDNIAQGVNVQGLRDARTRLSEGVYDGKIRSSVDQAAWKEILGNLSTDIEAGLTQAGRTDAARMFSRADAGWKARVEHIDQVLQPIVGKDGMKSGEDVLKAVETMARGGAGGNARLSRLLGNMEPAEAGQVRAVIIDRLGRATPGAQDAAGEVFAPSTFLTNWNKMTPQAKASLFSDKGLRRDLDDIATLSEGMKATRSLENFSNTAGATLSNVGAGVALYALDPATLILGVGSQYVTGRLMASPKFAGLLARSAKQNLAPEVANRRFAEQLGVLATKEPLIASDARQLQQFLNDAMAQSPGRAAAQGENE